MISYWLSLIPDDWIPALSSSAILALFGCAIGIYYKARVQKSVQHGFEKKIEALRSDFRKEEAAFRSDLQAKGRQIDALRSGALSSMASRHALLDKRRLDACDRLWAAIMQMVQAKTVTKMLSTVRVDAAIDRAAERTAEGDKMRKFADMIWISAGLDKKSPFITDPPIDNEQPYVSPLVWSLFEAYRGVLGRPVSQLAAMRSGIDSKILADPKPILDLVKLSLPHHAGAVDKHQEDILPLIVDELEKKLLVELQKSFRDPEIDQANLQQVNDILTAADKLQAAMTPKVEVPADFAKKTG
jgi:hypothetical protein